MRFIAETKYKIGLCHLLIGRFDESVTALKESAEYLDGEILAWKGKDQTAATEAAIKEIEETKVEIQNKIVEVEETKSQVHGTTHWTEETMASINVLQFIISVNGRCQTRNCPTDESNTRIVIEQRRRWLVIISRRGLIVKHHRSGSRKTKSKRYQPFD